tara:strand:+ start:11387 stop:12247 length:861 start_codon:yes stop_codon:yes gene_type:complete
MYLPKSQVEENLISNGNLVYKNTFTPYYGTYFLTSKGKYYANSPNDIILIELEIPIEESGRVLDADDPDNELSGDLRFNGLTNTLYSYLKEAPLSPPVINPPQYQAYLPTQSDKVQGYSIRYFAKKNTINQYIEISFTTYNLFIKNSNTVALNMYQVQNLIWYLQSPNDKPVNEINLATLLNFEKKYNWINFHLYTPVLGTNKGFLYTKGNELLFPNRTSYIGYYHFMPDGGIMTGKFHGEGSEIILIPTPNFNPDNSSLELETQSSTPPPTFTPTISTNGGGGGY